MNDNVSKTQEQVANLPKLIASVSKESFGTDVLMFVNQSAKLDNFGSFWSPDLKGLRVKLSIWSGKFGDYRFRNSARLFETDPYVRHHILEAIRNAPDNKTIISRWHPSGDDPRVDLYKRMGIQERLAISSRFGRSGYQSFFLRSIDDGWITENEMAQLKIALPIVHELITLRHRIVGSEAFQFTPHLSATMLRGQNLGSFARLSEREAEVCDYLIQGVTVSGTAIAMCIAESSVRTMRSRAYRKLQISSATELMSLMMHAKER